MSVRVKIKMEGYITNIQSKYYDRLEMLGSADLIQRAK
jgi:hypothetical protein